jgi:hypothetical protein
MQLQLLTSPFQISDVDSLWMWSRETLIPGLYSTEWYNGKKIKEGWIANNEDYLVGVPRIRLLRVEKGIYLITYSLLNKFV